MCYTMKEIQEKCLVTKKALRVYRKLDLIHPIIKDRILYFSDLDVTRIHCIQYYQSNGMQLAQIKKILNEGMSNTCICDIIQDVCVKLESEVNELQKQYVTIDRVLNNLSTQNKVDKIDRHTIMNMQEDHMILDHTMIPIKIAGVYVEKDIYCTKKEYHLLQRSIHVCIFLLIIIFIIAMIEKLGIM